MAERWPRDGRDTAEIQHGEQHRVGAEAALRAQQRQQALRAERVDLEECVGRDAEGEAEQRLLDVLPPEYRLDTLRLPWMITTRQSPTPPQRTVSKPSRLG